MSTEKNNPVIPPVRANKGYAFREKPPYIPFSVVMARFWRKVEFDSKTECWTWMGALIGPGRMKYGCLVVKTPNGTKLLKANRIALALRLGRWPKKEELALHRCHRPGCVNPLHIMPGTHLDNYWDSAKDGRMVVGVYGHCHARRSMSIETAMQIIDMYYGDDGNGFYYKRFNTHKKWTITSIAEKFKVPKAVIMRAVLEKSSWSSYLTDAQLEEARSLWRSEDGQAGDARLKLKQGKWKTDSLAKHFNLSVGVVGALIEGRTYRSIPRPVYHPNWEYKGTVQRKIWDRQQLKRKGTASSAGCEWTLTQQSAPGS